MDETSFFAMGGYGGYVWPAFGVTAAVLLGLWLDTLRRLRTGRRRLAQLEAQVPSRRARRDAAKGAVAKSAAASGERAS